MHKALPLLAVALLLLAGCSAKAGTQGATTGNPVQAKGDSPTPAPSAAPSASASSSASPSASPSTSSSPGPSRMAIHGVVLDTALHPLAANVTLVETGLTHRTGPGGDFRFTDLRPDVYLVRATAEGYKMQVLSVTPDTASEEMRFQLEANLADGAFNETRHFRGDIQCALEVLILSPSCDTLITDPHGLGRPDLGLFNDTSTFTVDVQNAWKTVVVDVVFDGSSQPLLDGLRVTVQGTRNQSALGTYQQYGRFNDAKSFTFRVEPGATYPEGTGGPVPDNTTAFRFEVFPQSKGWHATCAAICLLGVGTGTDVQFDLYVTTFYGQPAPDGFTFRTA